MKRMILLMTVCLYAWPVYGAFPTSGAPQTNYCFVPPYLTYNVKANIHLVLDFSGSMQFPAYLDCSSWNGYDSSRVADCGSYNNPDAQFLYNPNREYYGYFKVKDKNDPKKYFHYKYNTSGGYFEENSACDPTDYTGSISSNCLSGKLLNWITTTRTDVIRRILTGGRIKLTTSDVLESEGSRYVFTDTNLHCVFTVTAGSTQTRQLSVADQSKKNTCAIGTFTKYNMDAKVSNPADDITGVLQSMYPGRVDLELSVFNGDVGTKYSAGKNQSLTTYITAINNEPAYNGTPTGEALQQAEYFFQQDKLNITPNGGPAVIGVGDATKDPYYEPGNLPAWCKKSFVLLLSDGVWNDKIDPVSPAYDMHTKDMRSDTALHDDQTVTTYAVYAFGDGDAGRNAMIATAIFGGFEDQFGAHSTSTPTKANGWPYPFTQKPVDSSSTTTGANTVPAALAVCNPNGRWDAECVEWDKNKTGLPYNYFEGNDGAQLQQSIIDAFNGMTSSSASGTAASMLGSSDSSGSVMLQALYYPKKTFVDNSVNAQWIGDINAFWYYVDPSMNSAKMTLREDTIQDNKLKLSQDQIAQFVVIDNGKEKQLKVDLYDGMKANGLADSSSFLEEKPADDVKALWRAGLTLWSRLPTGTGGRTVYTNNLGGTATTNNLMGFSTSNLSLLSPLLDVASNAADATNVINYTLGIDPPNAKLKKDEEKDAGLSGYRSRTVSVGSETHAWKLGDIINSTPKLMTSTPLNTYNAVSPGGYRDGSYEKFVSTLSYKNRGVAFVGGNDGMLHAFKVGKTIPGGPGFVSQLVDSTDINGLNPVAATDLGKELWAYVPKNVLPYLKHLGNPYYAHLFYVDSTPTIVDASINPVTNICSNDPLKGCSSNADCGPSPATCSTISPSCAGSDCHKIDASWRTVLIGSMGLGGATRTSTATCTDCVKTPIDNVGYSSYFALDVTDSSNPKLMWEFSDPRLGYSTVGPAVVRIKDVSETSATPSKNGKFYVVLASGPTGPIQTNQMLAHSDKPLALFVLDMSTGKVVRTFSRDTSAVITGVPHTTVSTMPDLAFGGTFSNSTIDTDKWSMSRAGNYSDDAIYLGYVMKDTTKTSPSYNKFAKGGVLRILTGDDPEPGNWKVSTVIDGTGPVTAAVAKLQDTYNKRLWLYFGTGRYYYKIGSTLDEDYSGQQEAIYGIQEPCYISDTTNANVNDLDPTCTSTLIDDSTTIKDQTSTIGTLLGTKAKGWKIRLDTASGSNMAKRVYTNPTATGNGVVFFTTFKPSSDVCSYGGDTSLWAVNYDAGGSLFDINNTGHSVVGKNLKGQAMTQLATGELNQADLATAFTQSIQRETGSFKGPPSRDETRIISNANHFPSKKILHIMER